MGVLVQSRGLTEDDFRGERFRLHERDLKNNPDLLNLTQPEIVQSIHKEYLDARGRHYRDEYVHGDVDLTGRLWAGSVRARDECRGGADRATCGGYCRGGGPRRVYAGSRVRSGRATEVRR